MDFNKAFTFIFKDPQWVTKVLIFFGLSLVSIFIIPAFFISGYFAKTIRRVADGEEGLPEWENWGELLSIGFKTFVLSLILGLPIIIIAAIFFSSAITAMMSGGEDMAGAVIGGGAALGLLIMLVYGLLLACIGPAMLLQFVKEGFEIGAAFKFDAVAKIITANVANYALVVLVVIGVFFAGGIVGQIIPIIGGVIVMPFTYGISANLLGQLIADNTVPAETAGSVV